MSTAITQDSNTRRYVDHLSNLHESVLSHILSRLPTKDAVRISILSKYWNRKWTLSYNVEIDSFRRQDNMENFITMMSRVLLLSKHVISFRLHYSDLSDCKCLQIWMNDVLRHDLECFEVEVVAKDIVYPCSLLNSTSLRIIHLGHLSSTLYVATKNCAPNLTSLFLALDIENGDSYSSTMSFSFPVLETLTLGSCKWLGVKSVVIHAPSLTEFSAHTRETCYKEYDYSINIVAPKLITFISCGGLPEKLTLNGPSTVNMILYNKVDTSDSQLLQAIGIRVRNLINGLPNLEILGLSSFMTEVSRLGPPLQRHDKLTGLTLSGPINVEHLFELLHAMPSLTFLRLNVVSRFGPPLQRHDKLTDLTLIGPNNIEHLFELLHAMPSLTFLRVNVSHWRRYDYEAMEFVPSCIVSHLERVVLEGFDKKAASQDVEFKGYDGKAPEYDLAKFLLASAKKLTEFVVYGKYPETEQLEKVLSSFHISSSSLTIYVSDQL